MTNASFTFIHLVDNAYHCYDSQGKPFTSPPSKKALETDIKIYHPKLPSGATLHICRQSTSTTRFTQRRDTQSPKYQLTRDEAGKPSLSEI